MLFLSYQTISIFADYVLLSLLNDIMEFGWIGWL